MFTLPVGDHLRLKLLEPSDAFALFQITDESRRYLREWLPWVDAIKVVSDTQNFIRQSMTQYALHNGFQAGIWREQELVGCIGFHAIDWTNRTTTIGYWLKQSAQGHGIMTQATEALVNLAFHHYHLNRVEIHAALGNVKSRAIAQRLGFVQEGILRQKEWLYDHFVDHVLYAALKDEWAARSHSAMS
jgi:ribosomal-protein-serine acetyltransferase